ncbi:MAG: bifunctional diaminohydroxyphosphoribosylaminopyrimidine deaminase/5-amino-6-(5-phosphoribosylamino)uracil reductase RibD [Candidatus Pacebacteria bacterium]|nr:bifunctional diaminohydroxyphosphoribosylaminopyrimidine deaminase/5-amino-6-(5-phosphoribosylamino)uracil reductase RibD [Candidatus Paceibacterota bacterium]
MTQHEAWMRKALAQARRGWGRTSPNPLVGALVVREAQLVGKGYHERAGEPHAEVHALRDAGEAARGATLYVTLEPCSTSGRTPPCTEAIINAGIRRVVIGCRDPNPAHEGRAMQRLRNAGIEVVCNVLKASCAALNEAFFCWVRHHRPFVILKLAMTLDGKIATAAGESKWITGDKARAHVQHWRQWADAILVGGETMRMDNPSLTVRTPADWPCQPRKLVWTRRNAVGNDLKVCSDPQNMPRCIRPESPQAWRTFMRTLGDEEITALLVEGGGELAAACLRAQVVDKVMFFVAPKILGGRNSRPAVGGANPPSLREAVGLHEMRSRRIGKDLLITGYLSNVHRLD